VQGGPLQRHKDSGGFLGRGIRGATDRGRRTFFLTAVPCVRPVGFNETSETFPCPSREARQAREIAASKRGRDSGVCRQIPSAETVRPCTW